MNVTIMKGEHLWLPQYFFFLLFLLAFFLEPFFFLALAIFFMYFLPFLDCNNN